MLKCLINYVVGIILGVCIGVSICCYKEAYSIECTTAPREPPIEEINVIWRENPLELNKENLIIELKNQGVEFPEIVAAQAILETGHFKSYVCTNNNNLFGLRTNGKYLTFKHWTESVAAYKKYIQKWNTKPDNYYTYIEQLGYAEDKSYTKKLKQLVK